MTNKNNTDFQALALYEASMDIDESQREEWIKREAGSNVELLTKARLLLATEQTHGKQMLTGMAFSDTQALNTHPDRIGVYKITEFIGQGGMGAVYKGERDLGDFDLTVAIKLIRPGVLSEKLVERFAQEQQTLAKLVHPNIARLYDGGKTDDGAPYLIMEYVDGASLANWISKNELTLSEVLSLFRTVCDAVSYAHQNLIIHRDITPSNIMVTNSGEIKLIDFGIAKPVLDRNEADLVSSSADKKDSKLTLSGLSFTPGFAAPERKPLYANSTNGSKQEQLQFVVSTTLLDVYSLGKLLETMLDNAGQVNRLKAVKVDLPELHSVIKKATSEKPEDRYETVNALISDIDNYKRKFPISAYSTQASYRFTKFRQRHKKGVFVSSLTAVSLVVALLVSISQYYRAERNLEQAMNRFDQIRELSSYQIFDLFDQLSRVAGTTNARAELADKAQSYLAILSSQSNAPLAVKIETIKGYLRLAYVYGVPAQPNLGSPELAKDNLDTAEDLIKHLELDYANTPAIKTARADILSARAMMYNHYDGNIDKAKESIDLATASLQSIAKKDRDIYWHKTRRLLRHASLEWADQASNSEQLNILASALRNDTSEWPDELSKSYLKAQDENYYYYWLAIAHYVEEEHEQAVEDFLKANEKLSALEQEQKNDPTLLYQLAWTNYLGYGSATRLDDNKVITDFLDRASQYTERLKAVEEHDASIYRLSIQMREGKSQLLATLGDFEKALILQQAVVDESRENSNNSDVAASKYTLAFSLIILAYLHNDMDNLIDTCKSLSQAEQLLRPLAAQNSLPEYMLNAAQRLPERVMECESGEAVKSMNALFD